MLINYGRQLAHLALHYHQLPTTLDAEQVLDYLHLVKSRGTASATFFKFTVYGMRTVCRLRGLPYQQFCLPAIEGSNKLPSVLNESEVKQLMQVCILLKHRLLLSFCYGCGLRCGEVRNLRVGDVDLERRMVHIRQGKGGKDRILPLGELLCHGVKTYLDTSRPKFFLFEGNTEAALSQRGAQWVMRQAVKKSGILKEYVSLHTLRHSYATHLLEQGVNILTIKELLGHAHIDTTMIYLHLARPMAMLAFSPLDTLYDVRGKRGVV
ncbi:MAG: tyrosine-type recombinase/integrase [Ferruginibacter sp.]|nr:tyrosine-type recombinase/integrase [Ferruginibacter sp.]